MLPLRHSFKVVLQPNDGVIEREEDLISKSGKTPFGRAARGWPSTSQGERLLRKPSLTTP